MALGTPCCPHLSSLLEWVRPNLNLLFQETSRDSTATDLSLLCLPASFSEETRRKPAGGPWERLGFYGGTLRSDPAQPHPYMGRPGLPQTSVFSLPNGDGKHPSRLSELRAEASQQMKGML